MWRNYLTITIRILVRDKVFTVINILGLAIGLAVSVLLLSAAHHELSYDRWIENHESIFRIEVTRDLGAGRLFHSNRVPRAAKSSFLQQEPTIKYAVRSWRTETELVRSDGTFVDAKIDNVDNAFTQLFNLPVIEGDVSQALGDPTGIALTKSAAAVYFETQDSVLGRSVGLKDGAVLTVKAVIADLPSNTHFDFDALRLYPLEPQFSPRPGTPAWADAFYGLYLRLAPDADLGRVEANLDRIVKNGVREALQVPADAPSPAAALLRPVADIHFARTGLSESMGSDYEQLAALALTGVLTLVVAAFNYTNLSVARSIRRGREVALRKALGARQSQVIIQFLCESVAISALAGLLGLALAEQMQGWFASFIGLPSHVQLIDGVAVYALAAGLILFTGCVGAFYPALVASRFRPIQLLHGSFIQDVRYRLRSVLVIGQFAVAIGLAILAIVIFKQTLFAIHKEKGFEDEDVVVIAFIPIDRMEQFGKALQNRPEILDTVMADTAPALGSVTVSRIRPFVSEENVPVEIINVAPGYFSVLRIDALYGRTFSKAHPEDAMKGEGENRAAGVILNESAAYILGFETPMAAIGQSFSREILPGGAVTMTVVGVVPDFHFRSLREPVRPALYVAQGTPFQTGPAGSDFWQRSIKTGGRQHSAQ